MYFAHIYIVYKINDNFFLLFSGTNAMLKRLLGPSWALGSYFLVFFMLITLGAAGM